MSDISLNDHHLDTGIVELMLQLALGVERVGIHHHHPRAQGTQTDHQILDQIGHLNRDPVAPRKACAMLQPAGKVRRQAVEIGVAQGVTDTATGRLVTIRRQRFLEERDNRGVAFGVDMTGYSQRIKLRGDRALDRFRHGVSRVIQVVWV